MHIALSRCMVMFIFYFCYWKHFSRVVVLKIKRVQSVNFIFMRWCSHSNVFPEYFPQKYQVSSKVSAFLRLPFYGDQPAKKHRQELTTIVQSTYPASNPVILFSTSSILAASSKDRLRACSQSCKIHAFDCSCGTGRACIGRAMR